MRSLFRTFGFIAVLAAIVFSMAVCSSLPPLPPQGRFGVWYETAWAEWQGKADDDRFFAQIRLNGGDWKNVDNELVRKIDGGNTWRVDIPGLSNTPGSTYDVQILNAAFTPIYMITGLRPVPFDRQGYAFSLNPENGQTTTNGGYNDDGTIKEDAVIYYITQDNVNFILKAGAFDSYAKPVILRFIGKVGGIDLDNLLDTSKLPASITATAANGGRMYRIQGKNITIEGIGPDASIEGWGLLLNNHNNVVVRNIKFDRWWDDAMTIQASNESHANSHTWVTHNTFGHGVNRFAIGMGEADHVKGDGATDVTNGSTHFTISYNQYIGSGKSMLMGGGNGASIGHGTVHHNWYRGTSERTPRLRNGWVHVFNNLYDNVGDEPGGGTGYGIGAGNRSNIVAEGNTFIHTHRPYCISGESSGVAAGANPDGQANTFGNDAPGIILTSLYKGSPSALELTGRDLVPNEMDEWSRDGRWYFENAELVMANGPTITNNLRPNGQTLTYTFVPFHTAMSYRTDGSAGAAPNQSPALRFTGTRAAINDTLSSLGVETAAAGAARAKNEAGTMPIPSWW